MPADCSLLISTQNEEELLSYTLSWCRSAFNDCVVLDDNSTDKTVEIAKSFSCRIFPRQSDPNAFGANIRLELEEHAAYDWVFHCFDSETEILTKDGWKLFSKVCEKDEVMTLNPTSLCAEYQQPTRIIVQPYKGMMIHLRSRRFDLCVTPEHKLFFSPRVDVKGKRKKFGLDSAAFMLSKYRSWYFKRGGAKWTGRIEPSQLPKMDLMLFVKLLGWWLAEGYVNQQGFRKRISIAQKEGKKREQIRRLIRATGAAPINDRHQLTFYNHELFDYLKPLGHAKTKFIPKEIKQLPPKYLKSLLYSYLQGDGCFHKGGFISASTISKQLADDLTEITLKCGWCATVKRLEPRAGGFNNRGRRIIGRSPTYQLYFNQTQLEPELRRKKTKVTWEPYSGHVYCVTVPNHIIYVRRNGFPIFAGNCDADELIDWNMLSKITHWTKPDSPDRLANVVAFKFPRYNSGRRDWPDYQIRLVNRKYVAWRRPVHPEPVLKRTGNPVDEPEQVNGKTVRYCQTLDMHPLIHLPRPKERLQTMRLRWAKLEQAYGVKPPSETI